MAKGRGIRIWHIAFVSVALLVTWSSINKTSSTRAPKTKTTISSAANAARRTSTTVHHHRHQPVSSTSTSAPVTTLPPTTSTSSASGQLIVGIAFYSDVPAACAIRGNAPAVLPDPRCTPGAINPDVSPATLGSTICQSGWTSTVRPSSSFTTGLKIRQMNAWGIFGSTRVTEEDHLIPLELGGAPSDSRNLWPEAGGIPNPKDRLENELRRRVCTNQLDLSTAQHEIATDWVAAYQQIYGSQP
jgi:hypothetical protein